MTLLEEYEKGCGFKRGDVLTPISDKTYCFDVVSRIVTVLDQSPFAPFEYTVLGEAERYSVPSERFVKFNINGHDWRRV